MIKLPKLLYRLGFHKDILSHSRFFKITSLFTKGPIETLEIGTGGGVFSIELLERRNKLHIVEIDGETAKRTEEKMKHYFPGSRSTITVGHANRVELGGPYHQVVLLEVLEHVIDDRALLYKVSRVLHPGGRIIISTPTASFGKLRSDHISTVEDGGHVRMGYDGPDLDVMLQQTGLVTVKREFYGFWFSRLMEEFQRALNILPRPINILSKALVVLLYKLFSFLDYISMRRPYGQVTLAQKKKL